MNLLHANQATFHLLALESWGIEVLIDDKEQGSTDSLNEDWARELPPVSADGGFVSGKIRDLQGQFNLNSLVNREGSVSATAKAQFTCLLQNQVGSLVNVDGIVDAVIDWIDSNSTMESNGAEDLNYLGKDPSYRTAGQYFSSPTELLLIDGMNFELWEKIRRFVTALPVNQLKDDSKQATFFININTAPLEVLECLNMPDSAAIAETVISERSDEPFESWGDVEARLAGLLPTHIGSGEQPSMPQESWLAGVQSEYFQFSTLAEFGDLRMQMQHLVERKSAENIRIMLRSYGEEW
jgi:general secretion pathway protein K